MYKQKVKVALEKAINKGLPCNLNGDPVLKLKNGKQLIITKLCGKWFVKRDFGFTFNELARDVEFDAVVDIVIEQGK